MRISDWSSDVCSSDLRQTERGQPGSADDRCQPRDLRDELLWRDPGLPDLCARDRRKRRRRGYQRTVGCRLALAPPARGIRSLEGGALELYQCHSQRRSEEHTSELQSLMRNSYAVFCLNKKTQALYVPRNFSFTHNHYN